MKLAVYRWPFAVLGWIVVFGGDSFVPYYRQFPFVLPSLYTPVTFIFLAAGFILHGGKHERSIALGRTARDAIVLVVAGIAGIWATLTYSPSVHLEGRAYFVSSVLCQSTFNLETILFVGIMVWVLTRITSIQFA